MFPLLSSYKSKCPKFPNSRNAKFHKDPGQSRIKGLDHWMFGLWNWGGGGGAVAVAGRQGMGAGIFMVTFQS